MLCEYQLEAVAVCPADKKRDIYTVTVRSSRLIPVEEIVAAIKAQELIEQYQEDYTHKLHRILAAEVETVGYHSGVRVRCVCGSQS